MSRLFVSLLTLFVSTAAFADGSLVGATRTSDGVALAQIVLVVSGPAGERTIVTGPEGRFRVDGLAAGTYTVSLETSGFVVEPTATFTVADGATPADITLSPAPVRERVLVSATRGDAPASTLGVATSVLDRDTIAEREAPSFLDLAAGQPGLATARTGGLGSQGSLFVRGGESRFARVLVDGVPVNEPGGAVDFGSALAFELERVEIVRGAASSLYGTDALAGVVNVVTRRALPGERPGIDASAEGGSFGTSRFQAGTFGRSGKVDWNVGGVRLDTDNEVPNNTFEETAGAASVGVEIGAQTNARFILRALSSTVGTPGQTAFGPPDLEGTFDRDDLVFGATLHHAQASVSHDLRIGYAQTHQLSRDPVDSGSFTPSFEGQTAAFPSFDFVDADGFQNDVARLSAGYQAELPLPGGQLVTVGADLEHETGDVGSRAEPPFLSPSRTNAGGFLQDRFVIAGRAYVTLGGRLEHNDNFGWKAVPRAALAFQLTTGPDATTLRASAGKGIKEPDFFQSYGVSFFAQGNPDLLPERSRTWDVGLEQRLANGRVRAEATWFDQRYFDQIAYQTIDFNTFEATYVNLGETKAQGLETALELAPVPEFTLRASYTYLDGEIVTSGSAFDPVYAAGEPLLRRPTHQGSFTASGNVGRLSGGATVLFVGSRADSDFAGIGLTVNDGYTRVDARVRFAVKSGFEVFVVGENLFDEEYMEALGYPALGRAVRAGLRFRSGK